MRLLRQPISLLLLLAAATASTTLGAETMNEPTAGDWLANVRDEHPRMFLNPEILPVVREYALTHERDYYGRIKRTVDGISVDMPRERLEGGSTPKYGGYAQMCAFVWLMEADRSALEKARHLVLEGVRFYNRKSSQRQPVNWYSASRVCAMTAYDWIYDQLTPEEREEVVRGLVTHYREALGGSRFPGQSRGGIRTGFYGPPNMAWYVGLATHADGFEDDAALELLKRGYEEHMELMDYRSHAAGDDGGMGSLALGYAFGMYPWAEFNFMHTLYSSTGIRLENRYDHMSLFPNWVTWNYIPGGWRYGFADSGPAGRFSDGFLDMHMLQIAHFYADRYLRRARLAMWVRENLLRSTEHDALWWPLAPFFTTRCGSLPEPQGPDERWPMARNFENMGMVFMRSGWSPEDTYAAFVCGGSVNQHRHYDQGHFIIFKGGFQALDSGSYGPRARNDHLTEYFYRTVAHNAILIDAPAEADTPARIWGGPGKTLDGGQYAFEGKQIAFETNDVYSYAATDATACYDPRKCEEAVRQFVFVYPDYFVICDRVTAAEPGYGKRWLLHSVDEPQVTEDGFRVQQGDGALVCRAVFPEDRVIETVGGPGKEYWSAGSNHPQEGRHRELSGSWRVEVSPGTKRKRDVFVNVLRVGDQGLESFDGVEGVDDGERIGVRFPVQGGTCTVAFNRDGEVGGHVRVTGPNPVDRQLTTTLQPQSGIVIEDD